MKKSIILLFIFIFIHPVHAQTSSTISKPTGVYVLQSDPTIAHYRLNDNASNTNVVDSSINAYHLTATSNTDTLTAAGKLNGSLDFNNLEGASLADDDTFNFGDGSDDQPFSVCAWIYYVATIGSHQTIASVYGASEYEWWFDVTDDNPHRVLLYLVDASTVATLSGYSTSGILTENDWNHACGTYDGTETHTGINIYVNGSNVNGTRATSGSYTAMENGSNDFAIGMWSNSNHHFEDKIDNLQIFNRELTSGEVSGIYNSGSGTEDLFSISNATIIGNSSTTNTTNHNLSTVADLIVEGDVEVDGNLYVDGTLRAAESSGIQLFAHDTAVTTGTIGAMLIDNLLDGYNVTDMTCAVVDQGVTGSTDVTAYRRRSGSNTEILSTDVTIGAEQYASDGVINVSNDDLLTGDIIQWNVTGIHSGTAPNGLSCTIKSEYP